MTRMQPIFTGNVAALSLTTALNVMGQMIWYPVLPLFFRELGASDFQQSLAYGLFAAANALMQLPGGMLADRFGRKRLVAWPTFVIAVAFVAAGLCHSWLSLAVALFAQAACSALQAPSFVATLAESVPAHRRGEAFPYVPMSGLFFISAGVFLVSAVARQLFLRETLSAAPSAAPPAAPPAAPSAASEVAAALEPAPAARVAPAPPFRIGMLFRGRLVWLTVTALAIAVVTNVTLNGPFVPLLAHDALGLSKGQIDVLYAAGPLFAAVFGVAMGRLVARRGGRLGVSLGLLVAGGSLLGFLAAGPGPSLAVYIGAAFCVLGALAARRVARAPSEG